MKNRQNYPGGSKWEDVVGYSRVVKSGKMIWVSGTVAVDEEGIVFGANDAYAQTKFIIQKVEKFLLLAGSSLENVVRTRLFVTDISRWEEVGKAHGEFFKNIKPATTMVEVKALISPDYLIEIEMDAVISE
jgi:enamine deaminase RidA (YjgF/YER057c/UK114 family)